MKTFDMIVCHEKNRGIGKNNLLPWHCKKELQFFKEITTKTEDPRLHNAIVMGRKTWDSLPKKPLPDRYHFILSRTMDVELEFCRVFADIEELLKQVLNDKQIERVFIIGGEQLYKQLIFHKQRRWIYVTEIFKEVECDAFFPEYRDQTKLVESFPKEEENGVLFQRNIYE